MTNYDIRGTKVPDACQMRYRMRYLIRGTVYTYTDGSVSTEGAVGGDGAVGGVRHVAHAGGAAGLAPEPGAGA